MRVAIVGAGAIGGLMGAAFARGGHDVTLLARGAHLAALRADGLAIRTAERTETLRLPACESPAECGVQDVVVIALKAHGIPAMLPRLAPMIGPATTVVPAINGVPWWYFARHPRGWDGWRIDCLDPDGAMARALPAEHILGCVVHAAGEVVAPGVVSATSSQLYFLGEPDGARTARLAAIARGLRDGGADARESTDIRNDIWMKLIGNMSYNPVAALTLARMDEINANEAILDVIRAQMAEAMRVAEHYGERISMTIEERIAIARTIGRSKISMHQDIERGRPLEIDAIVTSVLELARKAGIATPTIAAVHALLAERARHPTGPTTAPAASVDDGRGARAS